MTGIPELDTNKTYIVTYDDSNNFTGKWVSESSTESVLKFSNDKEGILTLTITGNYITVEHPGLHKMQLAANRVQVKVQQGGGRRKRRRSSKRRRSKRRSSKRKRRRSSKKRKGSCANKRKSRSCRRSKRCSWTKGSKRAKGHCRRSKNRK